MAWYAVGNVYIASLGENQGTLRRSAKVQNNAGRNGVILDYRSCRSVFALILIIPNLILLLLMRKYVGPETLARGYKMN